MNLTSRDYDTLERLQAFQRLNRVWRSHLTSTERDFICYVLDNTVSWGRNILTATVAQMVDGTKWLQPVGLSRRTVFNVLASLVEKGLIRSVKIGRKVTYAIDVFWNPAGDKTMPIIPEKKAKAEAPKHDDGEDWGEDSVQQMHRNEPVSVQQMHPYKTEGNFVPKTGVPHARPRVDDEGREIVRKQPSIRNVWTDTWTATFTAGICPVWNRREQAQMKRVAQKVLASGVDLTAFVTFSVSRWNHVINTRFGWMKNSPPPRLPSVPFLERFLSEFLEAFTADKIQRETDHDFTREEAIRKLVRSGMTHEEAAIEYGKRVGASGQRNELAKREADINRRFRALENAEARKVAPVSKPSHPPRIEGKIIHGDNPFDNAGADFDFNIPNVEWVDE